MNQEEKRWDQGQSFPKPEFVEYYGGEDEWKSAARTLHGNEETYSTGTTLRTTTGSAVYVDPTTGEQYKCKEGNEGNEGQETTWLTKEDTVVETKKEDTFHQILIIDGGSCTMKCTIVNQQKDDHPVSGRILEFPSIVGRLKHPIQLGIMVGMSQKDACVGDEAQSKREFLTLKYPIEHGIVWDWENMEKLWHHTFYNRLRVAPEEHPVLLTEPPLNPKANRERMTQIMFERFNVPALYVVQSAVVSLLSADGRTTGILVDGGDSSTTVVPVYEGYILAHALVRPGPGGRDVTDRLMHLLGTTTREVKYAFCTTTEREFVRDMKEHIGCYVAVEKDDLCLCQEWPNNKLPVKKPLVPPIKKPQPLLVYPCPLPGQPDTVQVGHERFQCCECLFRPWLLGRDSEGIVDILHRTLLRCEATIQSELYFNVVLCGGTMMFPGMAQRMAQELQTFGEHKRWCANGVLKHLPGAWMFLMCAKKGRTLVEGTLVGGGPAATTVGDVGVVGTVGTVVTFGTLHTLPTFLLRHVLSFHRAERITVSRDKYAAVRGGCNFAKEALVLNNCGDWILTKDYEEYGPEVVHRKCR